MRLLILVRGSVRMPMTILMVVSLAPPGRGGFAGDFLALFFMGAGSVELYRYRIFGGPGQWERNLRKVSPPHPLSNALTSPLPWSPASVDAAP